VPIKVRAVTLREKLLTAAPAALLGIALACDLALSRAADWQPPAAVVALLVLCVASDALAVDAGGVRVSGAFHALVLAMVVLGPVPASIVGLATMLVDAVVSRTVLWQALVNLATYASFPLLGALTAPVWPAISDPLPFAAVVLALFMVANVVNFSLVAGFGAAAGEMRFGEAIRSIYLAVLPTELAMGLLTAGVAYAYRMLGVAAVALMAVVLLLFQYLIRTGVRAHARGRELERRTGELVALHHELVTTVMQTLAMRDPMTARHSGAVARYARETAHALGLSEREQDLIHTAGLLHDIGKFTFPDAMLTADRKLTPEEWETVKQHPAQGAELLRRIEGYGPVADIVVSHHERIDGRGYPHALAGEAIPLASRILAVVDTYDAMTARDSYRRSVCPEAAIAELRRVAGTQLDAGIVEAFVGIVEVGQVAFRHADAADFEAELAAGRRAAAFARPRAVAC
jgi:putative nucleotidyltransferase with HDIG domain